MGVYRICRFTLCFFHKKIILISFIFIQLHAIVLNDCLAVPLGLCGWTFGSFPAFRCAELRARLRLRSSVLMERASEPLRVSADEFPKQKWGTRGSLSPSRFCAPRLAAQESPAPQLPTFGPQAVRRQSRSLFCRVLLFPPLLNITWLNVNVLGTEPNRATHLVPGLPRPCRGVGAEGWGSAPLRPLSCPLLPCASRPLPADSPYFRFQVG